MIFRLTYCNKSGDTARVDIITQGGASIEEVEGSGTPFQLSYKMDTGDKGGHIMTSSADINIYETPNFNIDTLKTSSETDIRIHYYENDELKWTGFVIPDFFQKEITGSDTVVSMTASDRIGALKGITLSDLPSNLRIWDLLERALSQTGLSLPLRAVANFGWGNFGYQYNDYLNRFVSSQRLTDTRGRSINCYDILHTTMVGCGAFLTQRNGQWWIMNKLQHEAGVGKVYETYNTSTEYIENIVNFSDITRGAIRSIVPVASSVSIYQEYGGGKTYPENYDFRDGITGWTAINGFQYQINDKLIKRYVQVGDRLEPEFDKNITTKKYLMNAYNPTNNNNVYLRSPNIPITIPGITSIELNINVNGEGLYPTYLRFMVVAEKDGDVLALNESGAFTEYKGDSSQVKRVLFPYRSGYDRRATTASGSFSGVLKAKSDETLDGYNIHIRLLGSMDGVVSVINSIELTFKSTSDAPKGAIYKREQGGSGYTKVHEPETTLFGDYLTIGRNGYFYPYNVDDTSTLRGEDPDAVLTPEWQAYGDSELCPLMLHVVRQRARLFSIAHDRISGEIDLDTFDPLAVFVDCNGKRYTIVSATFDFLRETANVVLEQVAYGKYSNL